MTPPSPTPAMVAPTNMWDKAFDSLSDDLKAALFTTKTHKRDILVSDIL